MHRGKLSPEMVRELHALAIPVRKEKGAIVFREGQRARGAFLIRSGAITLSLDGVPNIYPSRTMLAGAVIGLPATFSGEPYSLTAKVSTSCSLDFISRSKLLNLLGRKPDAGFEVVRLLSEEIFHLRKVAKRKLGLGVTGTETVSRRA